MKHLRLFTSHSAYQSAAADLPDVCVVYDKEEMHYKSGDKTYGMTALYYAADGTELTVLNSND